MKIIAGSVKGRRLKPPRNNKIRPTAGMVKSAFFNMVGDAILGAKFLDLFAGTGNMGIEALSRGADRSVFVDNNRISLRLLRENLFRCGFMEQAGILGCDAMYALQILKKNKFFLILSTSTPLTALTTLRML